MPNMRRRGLAAGVPIVACVAGLMAMWGLRDDGSDLVWTVDRGNLVVELIAPGTLRAARSVTYRSPVNGRELEIVYLAPEGVRLEEGDLVARLETRDLETDLRQARDSVSDVEFSRQVADLEMLEATAEYESMSDGEGALTLEESRTGLVLTEKKAERLRREVANLEPLFELVSGDEALLEQRLRREVANLEPLLEQGFITRDELERSVAELETVEADLVIARRRSDVLLKQTHPLNHRRAELLLAQKRAQRDGVNRRLSAARRRVADIEALIERCTIYADSRGLVVYEEFMASSPRRKVRLGDRVTPSQAIARVVEVGRMIVDTSVPERSVHRVQPGQSVNVLLEAFPDRRLSGQVMSIGVLARTTRNGTAETKRFDVAVEMDPSAAELRPEMTARVDIRVGERRDVVRLPVSALFERDGLTLVNVHRGGRVETRQVEVGEQDPRFVEVLAGVTEGEKVMLVGEPAGGDDPSRDRGTSLLAAGGRFIPTER